MRAEPDSQPAISALRLSVESYFSVDKTVGAV